MENNKEIEKKIVSKDGILFYTEDGKPVHAGIVEVDGSIYYAGKHGEIVRGKGHIVHSSMSNGLVEHGTYKFDEDGKIVMSSFNPPKKKSKKKSSHSSHSHSHGSHRHSHRLRKRTRRLIAAAAAATALVLILAFVVKPIFFSEKQESTISGTVAAYLKLKDYKEPVYLCSDDMKKCYLGEMELAEAVNNRSQPYKAFYFEYNASADSELYLDGKTYKLPGSSTGIVIDNLQTNREYKYTVKQGDKTYDGSFTTAETNRFIYMDGAKNTRDIGGYEAAGKKRVKQGMIIRGSEIDGLVEKEYKLKSTEQSDDLGFKYDMDLRDPAISQGEYISPLGKQVRHKFYDAPMYAEAFYGKGLTSVKEIFDDLANPANYPMYLHCTYGADRTGTVVFLLQGLLGVDYNNMVFDFKLTGFSISNYASGDVLSPVNKAVSSYPGKTISDKVEYFLVNEAGVSQDNIDSIRKLLLE